MKKLVLLIACVAMFVGCTKDDPIKEPEKPNTPIITPVFSSEVIGVNQLLRIHAKSVDQKGLSLPVQVNDKSGWTDNLLIPVDYRPTEVKDYKFEFTSKSSTGESATVTKTITVLACDFMFGIWGDKKEDIIKNEDGLKDSGFTGYWLNYSGGKIFQPKRSYYFEDDKILTQGKISWVYVVSPTDPAFVVKMLRLTDTWKSQIADLTKVFGTPTSNTFPIEFDSWSQTEQIQYIQTDIDKTRAVFKNTRTEVTVQIYYYGNSNLGFNTETIYSKL